MSGSLLTGTFKNILAGPYEFNYREREFGKMVRIGRLLLEKKIIQGFRIRSRRKLESLCGCQMHDAVPTFRGSHDSPQRRNILEKTRHHSVSGDHEIFNQFRGTILLLLYNVQNLVVQHQRTHFVGLKVQSSMTVTLILQLLSDFILQLEL